MKNIICGIDDKYYQHCGAMLVSLFKHNDDTFHVYILSLELTGEHKKVVEGTCGVISEPCIYH